MAVPNLTPNSPVAGSIAWSAFSIQYGGVGYSVAAGSTPNKYVWWVYNGGSPSLQAGNTLPTNLTADDIMLFVNKAGIPVNVQASTVIDGSLVVDGSIIGTAIAAGTVHGDRIQGGTLTIGHTAGLSTAISGAQSGAVTEMKNLWGMPGNTTYIDGRDIYTGTVAAQSIAIADFNNYAYDGMFTYPFGTVWSGSGGSITTSTTEPNYLEIPSVVGTNQDHYAGANFPVLPGDSFFVSYEVLAPATNTAWNNVNLHIACRNDAAITNQWPSIGKPGSELQAAPDTWQKVTGVITIPSGAVEGRVGLAVSTLTGSTGNKFRFRNVMVMKRNSGELIVDGAIKTAQLDANAITSKHTITGPLFQTTATANRGIKIVSSANGNFGSLVAYDGSSVPTLTINGQDGSITMKGALESGSSVTGATVQTTATASRGIKLTSAGLIGYSDTGEAKFTLTPTGGLTLKGAGIDGAITTGGSIEGATITGGVLQTVNTAFRGIKIVNNKLMAYPSTATSDADANFVIDGTTGSVSMKGTLTGASVISGNTTVTGRIETVAANGSKAIMEAGSLKMFSNVAGEVSTGGMTAGSWTWNGVNAAQTIVASPRISGSAASELKLWQGNNGKAGAQLKATDSVKLTVDDTYQVVHAEAPKFHVSLAGATRNTEIRLATNLLVFDAGTVWLNAAPKNLEKPVDSRQSFYLQPATASPPDGAWRRVFNQTWIPIPQNASMAHVAMTIPGNTDTAAATDSYFDLIYWNNWDGAGETSIGHGYAHNGGATNVVNMGGSLSGWVNVPSRGSAGQYMHIGVNHKATGGGWVALRPCALNITFFS